LVFNIRRVCSICEEEGEENEVVIRSHDAINLKRQVGEGTVL
jgi:hypothetical protein